MPGFGFSRREQWGCMARRCGSKMVVNCQRAFTDTVPLLIRSGSGAYESLLPVHRGHGNLL